MPKKPCIKYGDTVVFAQRYLFQLMAPQVVSKTGTVTKVDHDMVTVQFEGVKEPVTVLMDELELYDPSRKTEDLEEDASLGDYGRVEFAENHELGGLNRAQLIALKLQAQETDPHLDRNINQLLDD